MNIGRATTLALFCVAAGAGPTRAQSAAESALERFSGTLETARPELIEVRRDIHRHPELSGQEVRTAAIVAERLATAGFEVRSGVGGHGVVGVLRGGAPGPLLAFRADMDAVRSTAPDPVDFPSETPGVRHICGHDIHTTIGLALAEGLAAIRDDLAGSVMLIFQPAEEAATGANAMLEDDVFGDRRPDAVFAYHTVPYEVGQVGIASGVQMPGRDLVRIQVTGAGDVEAAARAAWELLGGVATIEGDAAFSSMTGPFVLAQGVQAAPAGDEAWSVRGTLTTSSLEETRRARERLEAGLADLRADDVEIVLDYEERAIAGVTNDPDLVAAANVAMRAHLGETAVRTIENLTPAFSEDFGSFQEETRGAMYFLGVSNSERGWVGMPHSPDYVADEEAIFVGANAMAAVFLELFERGLP